MSNAFARKYGLNPKDGPSVNFQKLVGRSPAELNSVESLPAVIQISSLGCRSRHSIVVPSRLILEQINLEELLVDKGAPVHD